MKDLVREETETTEETREATGETLFPNGHEGGSNRSDPIPYFGGLTQDEVTLWKNNGTRGIEHIDDNLFAAIMHGDEIKVRSRIGGADKVMSETEALILIRARQHKEEIEYEKMLEQKLETGRAVDEDAPVWDNIGHEADMDMRPMHFFGCDAYGGRYDRKKVRYYDRHGGYYDTKGYKFADGSYKTAGGDHYDAATHTVRLAAGGPAAQLPIELLGYGADVLRLSMMIAAARADMKKGAVAELRDVAAATADSLAASKEMQAAEAAAQKAVQTVTGEAPKAVAATTDDRAAAWMAAAADREAEELAQFERMVSDESFQRDAACGPGEGMKGHMSGHTCTAQDMDFAVHYAKRNVRQGFHPQYLSVSDLQDIVKEQDYDHDGQVDHVEVKLNNATISLAVPPLSPEANSAFRKVLKDVVILACRLKDHAAAAFAKKGTAEDVPYEAIIVQAMEQKPRLNFFRRAGAGLNMA